MQKGKAVNVLLSALRVLQHLGEADQPLRATHIARALDLTPSTCFNILQTLVHAGMLRIDPGSGGYEPDVGLIALAGGAIRRIGTRGVARARMEDLARRFQLTVTLWQRQGTDRVLLTDYCEIDSPVRIAMSIGQRLPMLVGALGRCMAAFGELPPEELARQYAALRSDNLLPFDAYLREVARTRAQGYGVDTGQFVSGITTISAPIRDAAGRPVAALSAVALSAQLPEPDQIATIGEALKEAADAIALTLPIGNQARQHGSPPPTRTKGTSNGSGPRP